MLETTVAVISVSGVLSELAEMRPASTFEASFVFPVKIRVAALQFRGFQPASPA